MLQAVAAVQQLLPQLLKHPRPSVACVCTTRPKYLVFDEDASRPACVVEFGDGARLMRIDAILSELHPRLPAAVPRPLACARWQRDTHVQIQSGLAGVPWFRMADIVVTPADWRSLLNQSIGAMLSLHAAIKTVPAWGGTVNVREALVEQIRRAVRHDTVMPGAVLASVEQCAYEIADAGTLSAIWQHGDFSLNNLMLSPCGVGVIDFDEFGSTMMPLHDAFGLALSFPMSQGRACPLAVEYCIERCVGPAIDTARFDDAIVRGLLFHHLLWRINATYGHGTRAALRARLESLLQSVIDTPGDCRKAVAAAFA